MIYAHTFHARRGARPRAVCTILAATVLWGCGLSPRDGERVERKTSQVEFGGYVAYANETIYLEALRRSTNAFTRIGSTTRSETAGEADSRGVTWYLWMLNQSLPNDSTFWRHRGSGSSRFLDIEVRMSGSASGQMSTFDEDAMDCFVTEVLSSGEIYGFGLIEACHTGDSVTISVPCGDGGEACCAGNGVSNANLCNSGLACENRVCTTPEVDITSDGMVSDMPSSCSSSMMGAPCEVHPTECGHGLTLVEGSVQCRNNRPTCVATVGVHYCRGGDNELCGIPASTPCQIDEQCAPGTLCNQSTSVCTPIPVQNCPRLNQFCYPPRSSPEAPPPTGARNHDICVIADCQPSCSNGRDCAGNGCGGECGVCSSSEFCDTANFYTGGVCRDRP